MEPSAFSLKLGLDWRTLVGYKKLIAVAIDPNHTEDIEDLKRKFLHAVFLYN
jgi:hypothetical protein